MTVLVVERVLFPALSVTVSRTIASPSPVKGTVVDDAVGDPKTTDCVPEVDCQLQLSTPLVASELVLVIFVEPLY